MFFLPVNLITGYTVIHIKESSKRSLFFFFFFNTLEAVSDHDGRCSFAHYICLSFRHVQLTLVQPLSSCFLSAHTSTQQRLSELAGVRVRGASVENPHLSDSFFSSVTTSVTFSAWFSVYAFLSLAEQFFCCVS